MEHSLSCAMKRVEQQREKNKDKREEPSAFEKLIEQVQNISISGIEENKEAKVPIDEPMVSCEKCSKAVPFSQYIAHMKTHKDSEEAEVVIPCDVCKKEFSLSDYQVHLLEHEGGANVLIQEVEAESASQPPLPELKKISKLTSRYNK